MIQLGPPPSLPPTSHSFIEALMQAIPFLVAGSAFLAMLIVWLIRYNEGFREFWAGHVCAYMEEHSTSQCDEMAAERYLLNEMTPAECEAFEAHIFYCNKCFQSLKSGVEFIDGIRRSPR